LCYASCSFSKKVPGIIPPVGLGFVRSPLWGSPAHPSRLSLTGSWTAAGEAGATPREAQNPERRTQRIGNMVPVPVFRYSLSRFSRFKTVIAVRHNDGRRNILATEYSTTTYSGRRQKMSTSARGKGERGKGEGKRCQVPFLGLAQDGILRLFPLERKGT
jgi:hypothetical protein